ncbi:40S ribosomal protein S4 [Fonticula alba]|uniref:40S ribosomal protein S4 n=1 Tax=Fonticula alba TaxID=691883 RepID=A0A058Z983_FONAL|nr:40S ribosomal protein S4 [Fonticula alba]KCV70666.1 40S ribosomal protein S4 [Fonticula alba]|eukprot:XP_009495182.1 40S ribosomal protein S4 [Fonticula alba]
MVRGPKKHLKRLNAPKHWMLDKLGGTFAPKPSSGPHKSRDSLPLVIFLRNRLKYALTRQEVTSIVMQRLVKIDNKIRTDINFPTGFMDVISLEKTGEHFRLLLDTKGRFAIHAISAEEAAFKVCKVKAVAIGTKGIPYLTTSDGRTIRYPDPVIKANDSVKVNLTTGKIEEVYKFDSGALAFVTGGHNKGRVGVIESRERHPGSFDMVHIRDALGRLFATRLSNIYVIGKDAQSPAVSLPRGKGVKLTIIEERDRRLEKLRAASA